MDLVTIIFMSLFVASTGVIGPDPKSQEQAVKPAETQITRPLEVKPEPEPEPEPVKEPEPEP